MTDVHERSRTTTRGGAPPTAGDGGETPLGARYGEWVDAAGSTRAGLLPQEDFFRAQVDLARAVDGVLGAEDVVVVAVPYELTFVGHVVERALELVGATLIGIGTSNTICPMPRTLGLMRRYGVTAMVASAATALELARADRAPGDGPPLLRTLVVVDDGCAPARIDRIAALWGASAIPVFGTAAVPVIATPCGAGALHLTEDHPTADLLGPSDARSLAGGRRGELVAGPPRPTVGGGEVTATGQLVELSSGGWTCACGDPSRVVVPLGRVVDAVTTAAGPVSAVDVERVLFDHADLEPDLSCEIRGGRFHVTCTPIPGDRPRPVDLDRSLHARLLAHLGVDATVVVTGPRTTEGGHR